MAVTSSNAGMEDASRLYGLVMEKTTVKMEVMNMDITAVLYPIM